MSNLFGSLTSAGRALDAQSYGLNITGQNIANVNTPGYARRVVDFAAVPPPDRSTAGGGVEVAGVRAARDMLLERRLRLEGPAMGRERAISEALSVVEARLGPLGQSLDARLAAFFDAFSLLASDPTSSSARYDVLVQGEALADSFASTAGQFADAQRDADMRVRGLIGEVNQHVERIASLNASIAGPAGIGPESLLLKDELLKNLNELAELVDVSVVERQDGGFDVTFGNGRPLVIGSTTFALEAASTGTDGVTAVLSGGTPVTSEITGGELGGWLHVRDTLLPDYAEALDALAYSFVHEVNTLHDAGFDRHGNDGGVFFTALSGPAGAAAAMAVDAALLADPGKIAAAGSPVAGDNATAKAMLALRDKPVLDNENATFEEAWSQLVYRVGRDTQAARLEYESRSEVVRQIQTLRDSVSGVSLDEETMNMMKFQRAYEANARFFQVVDEALEILLQSVGR